MILNLQGGIFFDQQKFEEAIDFFKKSLMLAEKTNDDQGKAMNLESLGNCDQKLGKLEPAIESYLQSLTIEQPREACNRIIGSLIKALKKLGRSEKARRYCERALAIVPNNEGLLDTQKWLMS